MENKNFQFRTNINCNGCVAGVKPHLDSSEGISEWNVDTTSKDKILSIKSEGATEAEIIEVVQKAGFKAEVLER